SPFSLLPLHDALPIFQERHIFIPNDLGNNTFVTVATRHLIPYFQFTFLSHINFSKLDNSCRQLIANLKGEFFPLKSTGNLVSGRSEEHTSELQSRENL